VLEVLGRFPQQGEHFDFGDLHITVEKAARRRVEQILIETRTADESDEGQV